ncbi:MAG: DUF3991 domain-containing protein [Tyzzerella sp.]|nr:DUF3991 domain-containing protein [Tyzzerella sp.]
MWYTEEEIQIAKNVDLVEMAKALHYTVQRKGRYYTIKEMDSIRIYDRRSWCRWSRRGEKGSGGGSQIDFLRVFAGLDFTEAVAWLLDFAGYRKMPARSSPSELKNLAPKEEPRKPRKFELPAPARNNHYLYTYLINERGISKEVVDKFVDKGLIYESRDYHNIVFKGLDAEGKCRFASMRGVFDGNGKPFKCDVAGNDKTYGFNVVNKESREVYVFEGAIDLMSYVEIHRECDSNLLTLGMLADAPLETFLKENPQITSIRFCLDNDEHGRRATKEFLKKYYELGYEVEDYPPPKTHKDYNEWLKAQKRITKEGREVRSQVL